MRGVDTAAIVINAHSGIEVNTRRVFAEAKKAGLGPDDRHQSHGLATTSSSPRLVESIQELFGKACMLYSTCRWAKGQTSFRGVASTLEAAGRCTSGALMDPGRDQ